VFFFLWLLLLTQRTAFQLIRKRATNLVRHTQNGTRVCCVCSFWFLFFVVCCVCRFVSRFRVLVRRQAMLVLYLQVCFCRVLFVLVLWNQTNCTQLKRKPHLFFWVLVLVFLPFPPLFVRTRALLERGGAKRVGGEKPSHCVWVYFPKPYQELETCGGLRTAGGNPPSGRDRLQKSRTGAAKSLSTLDSNHEMVRILLVSCDQRTYNKHKFFPFWDLEFWLSRAHSAPRRVSFVCLFVCVCVCHICRQGNTREPTQASSKLSAACSLCCCLFVVCFVSVGRREPNIR